MTPRPARPFDVQRVALDISRLQRLIDFEPMTLREGIEPHLGGHGRRHRGVSEQPPGRPARPSGAPGAAHGRRLLASIAALRPTRYTGGVDPIDATGLAGRDGDRDRMGPYPA